MDRLAIFVLAVTLVGVHSFPPMGGPLLGGLLGGAQSQAGSQDFFGGGAAQGPPAPLRAAIVSRIMGGGDGGLGDLLPSMDCEAGSRDCGRGITEQVFVGADGRPRFQGGPLRAFLDRAPVFCNPGSKGCGVHINYHVYLNPKPLGGVWERNIGEASMFRARRGPPILCTKGSDCGGRSQVMVHGEGTQALKPSHVEHSDTYSFVIHGAGIETFDPDVGQVTIGFHKRLVEEVCKVAGKKCVGFYDTAEHCFSHGTEAGPHPGKGLLDGWYDGCLGWPYSPFRDVSVDYSDAYIQVENTKAYFYVKTGNPNNFDPEKLTDVKLGILVPWASDFHCLRKHHMDIFADLGRDNVKMASHKMELRRMIVRGEVDAGFVNGAIMAGILDFPNAGLEKLGDGLECPTNTQTNTTTVHMISRKNGNVNSWWNDAFQQVRDSGKYYQICHQELKFTGEKPGCL